MTWPILVWSLYGLVALAALGGAYYFVRRYMDWSETPLLPADAVIKDWKPTGKIDFLFAHGATDNAEAMNLQTNCTLIAEDRRSVSSPMGVEHDEIRWRKATPNEAKDVVVKYHNSKESAA